MGIFIFALCSLDRVHDLLELTARRLRNVMIEQRDFAEILTRYDSPETWFYFDPPYVHFQPNGRYEALSEERRGELFALLAACQGKFLMSFDDCAEVRELSRRHRFKVQSVKVGYQTPLQPTQELMRLCRDITLQLLYRRRTQPAPQNVLTAYADAMSFLKRVADGAIQLDQPVGNTPQTPVGTAAVSTRQRLRFDEHEIDGYV